LDSPTGRRVLERARKFYASLVAELIEWAEAEFRASRKTVDGSTEREHEESGTRQWAKIPAALRPAGLRHKPVRLLEAIDDGPEFPELLGYLWGWFQEISWGLAPNGFAPPVITWETLRAWQEITRVGELEPWEARTLVQLGMLRASIQAEKSEASKAPSSSIGNGRSASTMARPSFSRPRRH
jgi:hypothetical protein